MHGTASASFIFTTLVQQEEMERERSVGRER